MSEGFSTPPAGRPADTDREVVETVRRIMGEDTPDAVPAADSRTGPGYSATPPAPAVHSGTPPAAQANGTSPRRRPPPPVCLPAGRTATALAAGRRPRWPRSRPRT